MRKIFLNIIIGIPFFLTVLLLLSSAGRGTAAGSEEKNDFSAYKIIYQRNIFKPLWNIPVARTDERSRQEELEALRRAEEERKELQKLSDEKKRIESKKTDIEKNYTLTGILFEDNKAQAAIQDRKGTTHFVYENDAIDDIKIISINESKGEVTADYQNKFKVTFKME